MAGDTVVVLSGMLGGIETDESVVSQRGDADRFLAGKAPLIISTLRQWPWLNRPQGVRFSPNGRS